MSNHEPRQWLRQITKDWGTANQYLYSAIHLGDKNLILMNCTWVVKQARYTLEMRLHYHRLSLETASHHVTYKPRCLLHKNFSTETSDSTACQSHLHFSCALHSNICKAHIQGQQYAIDHCRRISRGELTLYSWQAGNLHKHDSKASRPCKWLWLH